MEMKAIKTEDKVRGISRRGKIFSTSRYKYDVGVVEHDGSFRKITEFSSRNMLKKMMKKMRYANWSVEDIVAEPENENEEDKIEEQN